MIINISTKTYKKFKKLEELEDLTDQETVEYLEETVEDLLEDYIFEKLNRQQEDQDYDTNGEDEE